MSKVFIQHKNGDVSVRLTKKERHKISAILGKMRSVEVDNSEAFRKLYVPFHEREYAVNVNILPFSFRKI